MFFWAKIEENYIFFNFYFCEATKCHFKFHIRKYNAKFPIQRYIHNKILYSRTEFISGSFLTFFHAFGSSTTEFSSDVWNVDFGPSNRMTSNNLWLSPQFLVKMVWNGSEEKRGKVFFTKIRLKLSASLGSLGLSVPDLRSFMLLFKKTVNRCHFAFQIFPFYL